MTESNTLMLEETLQQLQRHAAAEHGALMQAQADIEGYQRRVAELEASRARMANALKGIQECLNGSLDEETAARVLNESFADFTDASGWLERRDEPILEIGIQKGMARGANYTANAEIYPTAVTFANGRRVRIVERHDDEGRLMLGASYLEVDMGDAARKQGGAA